MVQNRALFVAYNAAHDKNAQGIFYGAPGETGESFVEDRKSQFFGFTTHAESADEAIEFRHRIIEQIPLQVIMFRLGCWPTDQSFSLMRKNPMVRQGFRP